MTEPFPQPPGRELDLETLLAALWQQRRTFFTVVGTVLLVALLGSLVAKRKYNGVAVIQLLPRAGQELQLTEVVKQDEGGYLESRDRARTQIQIMLSRKVGEEVVRQYNDLGYNDFDTTAAGLERLRQSTNAAPREDTQLVEITVQHTNPERAALLANLTAKVYAQVNLEGRTVAAQQTLAWLDTQIRVYRERLDTIQKKLREYKESNELVNIDDAADGINSRINALQVALGETATQRVLLESRVQQHQSLLSHHEYDVLAGMFQDPVLQSLSTTYASVSAEAADVSARYGEQHPDYQRAFSRVKRVEGLIARQVRRGVEGEQSQIRTLLEQEDHINTELGLIKTELLTKQQLQSEYTGMKAEADHAQQLYEALVGRRMEVDLQARSNLNDVQVMDLAVVPTRAASPNVLLNLVVGLVLGVGAGFGLSLVRYRLQDTLQSPREVTHALQAPLLGVLPRIAGPASRATHSEALRSIRTVLLHALSQEHCRRILVTSTGAGEGKTHVAAHLAVGLAQMGARVLLIDAELRRPVLHAMFKTGQAPGLTNNFVSRGFVAGFQEDFGSEERLQPWYTTNAWRTEVPRLHLLPSGSTVRYPNELLSSAEMETVLVRLSPHYQYIIVDSAAVGEVSDAAAMARRMDGVVMVLAKGKLPRQEVIEAASQIRSLGGTILGVVLNTTEAEVPLHLWFRSLLRRPRKGT